MDMIGIHASLAFLGLGVGELALIFLILLLIFGGSKLPKVGEALGSGIRNFKTGLSKASDDEEALDVTPAGKLSSDEDADDTIQDAPSEPIQKAASDVVHDEVKPS
jgi:sec-independent protein translocase protein TatA